MQIEHAVVEHSCEVGSFLSSPYCPCSACPQAEAGATEASAAESKTEAEKEIKAEVEAETKVEIGTACCMRCCLVLASTTPRLQAWPPSCMVGRSAAGVSFLVLPGFSWSWISAKFSLPLRLPLLQHDPSLPAHYNSIFVWPKFRSDSDSRPLSCAVP